MTSRGGWPDLEWESALEQPCHKSQASLASQDLPFAICCKNALATGTHEFSRIWGEWLSLKAQHPSNYSADCQMHNSARSIQDTQKEQLVLRCSCVEPPSPSRWSSMPRTQHNCKPRSIPALSSEQSDPESQHFKDWHVYFLHRSVGMWLTYWQPSGLSELFQLFQPPRESRFDTSALQRPCQVLSTPQ